jgi:protein TonB
MKGKLKNIPGFNDLIFENRNKEYGAYQLRKKYKAAVTIGIVAASLVMSSAVILPVIITPHSDLIVAGGTRYISVQLDNIEPPMQEIYIPPAAPPPEPMRIREIVKYIPPVVVDTVMPIEKIQAATDEILLSSPTEQIELSAIGAGDGVGLLPGIGYGDGTEMGEPLFIVEVMPSFRGGDINKFRAWIQKRTNYPQIAIDKKIKGTVFLTFIVEKDGSVSNVTIVKGVHPLLDNEAVKAISESPKWSPGLQRGQPVRIRYQIPLVFSYN